MDESKKPTMLWVDLAVTDQRFDMPDQLREGFDIVPLADNNLGGDQIRSIDPAVICCDYDYPDRERLDVMSKLKREHPSIPVFIMVVQHSENLAVWAFRNGAFEYLVKPAPEEDLDRMVKRILEIQKIRRSQGARKVHINPESSPADIPRIRKGINERLAPAIFYVQKNYNKRIYSHGVARLCSMSAAHFSRAFAQTYNVTFQEFLLRYRISEACRQLRAPGASITEVAYSVGFTDASYFTRIFKRYINMPPSAFIASRESVKERIGAGLAADRNRQHGLQSFAAAGLQRK